MATFNLRMDTEKDGVNAWPNRKEMVKGLIRFHDFDIFGTQEGFKHMLDGIAELDGYAYIGAGRDDGEDAGEHSAIFYKTSRFDLLDKGNFWFSETPDVPGKGWDATCCNRICSWGKFRDKESGKDFNAVPTDEPMVTLASDGLLLDSYDLSEQPRYGTEGTYNSFKTDSEMMNRIDYIWVTKGTKVKKYAVLNDMQYGRFPSDHFPVMIQVTF